MASTSGHKNAGIPPRPGRPRSRQPSAERGGSAGGAGRPAQRNAARQRPPVHRPARAARRQRIYWAAGAASLVVVAIAVLLTVTLARGPSSPGRSAIGTVYPITPGAAARIESVPVGVLLAAAEAGPATARAPVSLPGGTSTLTKDGKPEILYLGANYCPYCAAERWALVMALSKFGTFTDLRGTSSSATDVDASTPTFTFYGASYKSSYLSFVAVETAGNVPGLHGTYAPLQKPTSAQLAIMDKWDAPPIVPAQDAGSIPFLYLGGRSLVIGTQYDASHVAGWTFAAAAQYLSSGNNATSKSLEAAAGQLIKSICNLTKYRPSSTCNGAGTAS